MARTPIKTWLAEHGYNDILAMIEELEEEWKATGKKTRRSWWEVLAGGVTGNPRTVDGKVFPVLKAAQRHEGKPVTKNAISKKRREKPPAKWHSKWDETAE